MPLNLIGLLITLIVYGAVFYIIWWAVSQIPMPEPIAIAVKVIFALVVALVLLGLIGVISGPIVIPTYQIK